MANRTVKDAVSVKGTNPQYLVDKIIRMRIYESRYWKEECFGLTAELLVDKAIELKSVGGTYGGNVKPTPFLCLVLKMLQIQPEKDIVIELIRNEDFKYVRALGAFYLRLVGNSVDIYKYLEPLYIDYRKMKRMNRMAKYDMIHMDELIDEMLHEKAMFDITLPVLQKRQVLEENNELEPRISPLEIDLDDSDDDDDDSEDGEEESGDEKKVDKTKESSSSTSSSSDEEERKAKKRRSRSSSRGHRRHSSSSSDRKETHSRHRRDERSSRKRRSRSRDNRRRKSSSSSESSRSRSRDRRSRSRERRRNRSDSRDRSRNRSRERSRERNRHRR